MRQCDVYRRKKIPEGFVKEFLYDGKRYVEARYITWHIESYKSKNMTVRHVMYQTSTLRQLL